MIPLALFFILLALAMFIGLAAAMTLVRVVFPLIIWAAGRLSTRRESR